MYKYTGSIKGGRFLQQLNNYQLLNICVYVSRISSYVLHVPPSHPL
jgi:hypothetical protein